MLPMWFFDTFADDLLCIAERTGRIGFFCVNRKFDKTVNQGHRYSIHSEESRS
jgi:hypothetical protein